MVIFLSMILNKNNGFLLVEQLIILSILTVFMTVYITGFTSFEKESTGRSFSWNVYFLSHFSRFSALSKDHDSLITKEEKKIVVKEQGHILFNLDIPYHLDVIINNGGTLGFKGSGHTKRAGKITISSIINTINTIKIGVWDGPIKRE